MNINKLYEGMFFNNSLVKLLLNKRVMIELIEEFYDNEFEDWEQRKCNYCEGDRLCRKHLALKRIQTAEHVVQVLSGDFPKTNPIYITKGEIFTFNQNNKTLLVFDCPPLIVKKHKIISDKWIRRFVPFTIGHIQTSINPKVIDQMDIDDLFKQDELYSTIRSEDEILKLSLFNEFGQFVWELETLKKIETNN